LNRTSELIQKISENPDEKAFKELFDLYAFRLVSFADSFLKNHALSEEVVSDVFLKIWIHRKDLFEIENFKAYLFKATRNTALNYMETEKRLKAERLEDLNENFITDNISPETSMISKELSETIDAAINHLPSRCKLIYNLAKTEKLKYKEISSILNISVKTIDSQVVIAVKKIGETIRNNFDKGNNDKLFPILLQLFIPEEIKKQAGQFLNELES